MGALQSSLSVPVASRPGLVWDWRRCSSPVSLTDELVRTGQHPSALFLEIFENGHVAPLDQRVVAGSWNGQQDQIHDHSVVIDRSFRETVPEVARGRGSSSILCTGSAAVVTAVVFGLQMKNDPTRVNEYVPWDFEFALRTRFANQESVKRLVLLCGGIMRGTRW